MIDGHNEQTIRGTFKALFQTFGSMDDKLIFEIKLGGVGRLIHEINRCLHPFLFLFEFLQFMVNADVEVWMSVSNGDSNDSWPESKPNRADEDKYFCRQTAAGRGQLADVVESNGKQNRQ